MTALTYKAMALAEAAVVLLQGLQQEVQVQQSQLSTARNMSWNQAPIS
jgi:hypothetical protein